MTREKNEQSLAEVRAILRQIQQIATEPEMKANASAEVDRPPAPPSDPPPGPAVDRSARWRIISALLAGGAVTAVAAAVLFARFDPAGPLSREVVERPLPGPAASTWFPGPAAGGKSVDDAHDLMAEGHIIVAREKLLQAAKSGSSSAALALARSFDPSVLRTIAKADAAADIVEAERWYRRWHELAVAEGLAMDAAQLERIIRAMR